MRVGVYVDGYNLYYGGRALMGGRGLPGWRWLDLRALATRVIGQSQWASADVGRVVFCTARLKGRDNLEAQYAQDAYLRAVVAAGSVDVVEVGSYSARVVSAPLAVRDARGEPRLVTSGWPVMAQNSDGTPAEDVRFIVSVARREEKGSDVNLASHLLIDVCEQAVDAAVMITNDSDLGFPLAWARRRVPVGVVNPTKRQLAGALRGTPHDGVGGHWWYRLAREDLLHCQLPESVGRLRRPRGW